MTAPRPLLEEAGATLRRAELLIEAAAEGLGEPFADALVRTVQDIERIRRRLRSQTITSTATVGGGGGG